MRMVGRNGDLGRFSPLTPRLLGQEPRCLPARLTALVTRRHQAGELATAPVD